MKNRKKNPCCPNSSTEDLFQCFKCSTWYPYFYYRTGCLNDICSADKLNESIKKNHRWACDKCFANAHLFQVNDGNKWVTYIES